MAIRVYYSNRVEDLCAKLAAHAGRATGNPLEPLKVFVPNPYVRDWVQMRLAAVCGIAANISYRLLDDGLWELFGAEGALPAGERDARLILYHLLSGSSAADAGPFAAYLGGAEGPDREKKTWQLAGRLADLFLAYETRRPDMIDAWTGGRLVFRTDMEHAQRGLYLSALGKDGLCVRAGGRLTLPGLMREKKSGAAGRVPDELHLFCESGMSPFHCGVIFGLGRLTDVFMYQVNPCAEYWEDMETAAEERWKKIKSMKIGEDADGEFLEQGPGENRLLQLWGRAGREDVRLMGMIEDASGGDVDFEAEWIGADAPARPDTVLGQVQRRVLARAASGGAMPQDTSLQVFRAPTVRREVEAVYSSILYNLGADPSLRMTDIAVMVPDMEAYSPHIRSVFGREPDRISYCMIDSTAAGESAAGAALMSLLDLAAGSFTRSEVFSLVMNPVFQHARGIGEREAAMWLSWAERLNVFREYRADGEMQAFSWQQGLRRLRLGRIMEDAGDPEQTAYRGIVPYSDMDSSDRETVGALSETIDLLQSAVGGIRDGRLSAGEWRAAIDSMIAEFISVPPDMSHEEKVLQGIRESLAALDALDRAGSAGMTLAFIREYLADSLSAMPGFHGRYLVSGVNVSALVPRRNIPFRICYVMGMGEGPFPGTAERSSLDLMSLRRRIGDVSRPEANGYLFLQILLSASGKIYLSYVSRDLQKDQDLEPNSLVAQLVSHAEESVVRAKFRQADAPLRADDFSGLLDEQGAGWQDVVSCGGPERAHVAGQCALDRFMFVRQLVNRGVKLGKEPMKKYSELERQFTPDFRAPAPPASTARQSGSALRVSIGDLCRFLEDPAQSRLTLMHGLGPSITADDPLLYNDEPLFSVFPDNYAMVSGAIERYVLAGDEDAGAAWLAETYRRLSMRGRSPGGAFMRVDIDTLARRVHDRITGEGDRPGLAGFVGERISGGPVRGIRFGDGDDDCEMKMPALVMTIDHGGSQTAVEIRGSLPMLWRREGFTETLVLNGTDSLRPSRIIAPFLFYVAAATGLHEELHDLMGSAPFCAHAEMARKINVWRWRLRPEQAREYLAMLVSEYLYDASVYCLPAAIVMNTKMARVSPFAAEPSDEERVAYRDLFRRVLCEESEGSFASYSPGELVYMIDPPVPDEACGIVRRRFGLLMSGADMVQDREDK